MAQEEDAMIREDREVATYLLELPCSGLTVAVEEDNCDDEEGESASTTETANTQTSGLSATTTMAMAAAKNVQETVEAAVVDRHLRLLQGDTAAPSISQYPTASAYPTAAPSVCQDTDSFIRNEKERTCEWVARRLLRCDKPTDSGDLISTVCPVTCDAPCGPETTPVPTTSQYPTQAPSIALIDVPVPVEESSVTFVKGDELRNCQWVSNRADRRCPRVTDTDVVIATLCPDTCSGISGRGEGEPSECEYSDLEGSFLRKGTEKTCDWVAKEAKKRCGKLTDDEELIAFLCPVTCEAPCPS
jgi:hypothetical protein